MNRAFFYSQSKYALSKFQAKSVKVQKDTGQKRYKKVYRVLIISVHSIAK
jgi:hypothetical protein